MRERQLSGGIGYEKNRQRFGSLGGSCRSSRRWRVANSLTNEVIITHELGCFQGAVSGGFAPV